MNQLREMSISRRTNVSLN